MSRGSRHGPWLELVPMCYEITNINQFPNSWDEIEQEKRYRIEERLGIMCEDRAPTDEQLAIAVKEADEWVEEYVKSLP